GREAQVAVRADDPDGWHVFLSRGAWLPFSYAQTVPEWRRGQVRPVRARACPMRGIRAHEWEPRGRRSGLEQSELDHLVAERVPREPERAGGRLLVALGIGQGPGDEPALKRFGRGMVVGGVLRGRRFDAAPACRDRAQDAVRQVARKDLVFVLEDEDTLQEVFQFPHVSRPGIAEEDILGLGGEAAQGSSVGAIEPADEMPRDRKSVV